MKASQRTSTPGVLAGAVQTYPWGSLDALPRIMGTAPTGEPQAELWLGAHPRGPAVLRRGESHRPLDQVIAADPVGELGADTARRYGGELPFLLKILAVAQPLSLQAHPDRGQAQTGFDAENRQGIPIGAGHRSFSDRNHKPELICALEPFTALCGFRAPSAAAALLDSLAVPELAPVVESLGKGRIEWALRWLLERPRQAAAEIALQSAAACARPGPYHGERQWAARIAQQHPGDIGVVIALMLNQVELQPGQALYLGPGSLHAYLHGVAVEIMSNSDNVLRGGLTAKHVNAPALLAATDCRAAEVSVLAPEGPNHTFPSPVPDFRLTRLEVAGPVLCQPSGPEIALCASGEVRVAGREIVGGGAVWLPAGTGEYEVSGAGLLFRARTGRHG